MLPIRFRVPLIFFAGAALAWGDVESGRWTLEAFEALGRSSAVWADSLLASSSAPECHPGRALGPPQASPTTRDGNFGWMPDPESESWIELSFPTCEAQQVWIVEDKNPGAIQKVVAIVSGGGELLVYRRDRRVPQFLSGRVFWLELPEPLAIERLKIVVSRARYGQTSLDAVALVPAEHASSELFWLAQQSLLPGESLRVVFERVQRPLPGQALGMRIMLPDAPHDGPPELWRRLSSGEQSLSLPVPDPPGSYILERVDMLASSQDAAARCPFEVVTEPDLALGFWLEPRTVARSQPLKVTFTHPPQPREGEAYWLALCSPGGLDARSVIRQPVPAGQTELWIDAPEEAGVYELQLHARSPTTNFHPIHRICFSVE